MKKIFQLTDLTSKITENFHKDCNYLKCETPNKEPKATENIKQMIEMITKTREKRVCLLKG